MSLADRRDVVYEGDMAFCNTCGAYAFDNEPLKHLVYCGLVYEPDETDIDSSPDSRFYDVNGHTYKDGELQNKIVYMDADDGVLSWGGFRQLICTCDKPAECELHEQPVVNLLEGSPP
jgi:hypothetical protein